MPARKFNFGIPNIDLATASVVTINASSFTGHEQVVLSAPAMQKQRLMRSVSTRGTARQLATGQTAITFAGKVRVMDRRILISRQLKFDRASAP